MADTKALFTNRLDAARTAWTAGDEPAAAECLRSAVFAARGDPSLRRELASALYHLGRLTRKFGSAGEAEAEPLLTEALAINEELFGGRDAALAPLLQELSRLYVQRSQHARAADALERLLVIARVKGEEHPDVAAALADLAFVRRKLGDVASAEGLYRDALRIRETALEPNHVLTVGTLERLSETCAARGNYAEALTLLERALPAREAALGAGHERVRAARSRVTELKLQIAHASGPPPAAQVPPPPPRPRERTMTPAVTAAVAAASLMVSSVPTPATPQIAISALQSARPAGSNTGRDSGAYRDLLLADFAGATAPHIDVASSDAAVGDTRSIPYAPARKRRIGLYAFGGVAAAGIAMAALLMVRPRAAGGKPSASAETSVAQRTAPVVTAPATTLSTPTGVAAMVAAARADSHRAAGATAGPAAAADEQEQHAPEIAPPKLRLRRVDVHLDSTNLPTMPATPSGEAILRSAMERHQRESDTNRTDTKAAVSTPAPADVANAHTSPKIIGRAPDPGFPDALLRAGRREGQVVVRFIVNELGRVDVSSMIVEQSDDELFTSAVRDVLPLFRFEPARTLTSESKPVAVWVSVPFRFTTKKR